jgi:7-carboxy-7-deazaguanine synthase (Cx14CxxC type)
LPDVICGRDANRTGRKPFVGTDGIGGGVFSTAKALADNAMSHWPHEDGKPVGDPWVICTGGEPLLQLNDQLVDALHNAGFKISVETNGTIKAPAGIDWLCVSPKADAPLVQKSGEELKLVYPQVENQPSDFENLDFKSFSLQPLDDPDGAKHRKAAFEYCMQNPNWRLSLQTHKWLGVR